MATRLTTSRDSRAVAVTLSPEKLRALRLARQAIARPRHATPAEVVAWFGGIQAQDYLAALWALGLRTPGAREATIEAALADGSVIRTHVFRGTWQYVVPADLRWMLGLVGKRVIAAGASRYRQLALDDRTLARACELIGEALAGGKQLTRKELAAALERGQIATHGRLLHILGHAELAGVICSGGRRGKQPTHALLDERVPPVRALARDEAIAALVRRYFQSRGPATIRDFVWWTGLTAADARAGIAACALPSIEAAGERLWFVDDGATAARAARAPVAHLLPAFDEYMVGYTDRSAMLDPRHARKANAGGGMLRPVIVVDGRVVGTWTRTLERGRVAIALAPFARWPAAERAAVDAAAGRYAAFVGLAPVTA